MTTAQKHAARAGKALSVRNRIRQRSGRPRLSVFRSLKNISCQIIDDTRGHTLVAASSVEKEVRAAAAGVRKTDVATRVGEMPVAEIPTEQLGVGSTVEVSVRAARTGRRRVRLTAGEPAALVVPSPAPYRLHSDTVASCVLGVRHALVRRAKRGLDGAPRTDVHRHSVVPCSDSPGAMRVPGVGFEPTSPLGQWCLRPPRIPFRQPGEGAGATVADPVTNTTHRPTPGECSAPPAAACGG